MTREIEGLADLEEAETPEQLMQMRVWNLTVNLMARAYALCLTYRPGDEYGVADEREAGRIQGIKDTCRKILITMREVQPFSGLYVQGLASATRIDESWMKDLERRYDEREKHIVNRAPLTTPSRPARRPGRGQQ